MGGDARPRGAARRPYARGLVHRRRARRRRRHDQAGRGLGGRPCQEGSAAGDAGALPADARLAAPGRVLGALTLATSESGRRYEEREIALVIGLAGRAALAVDNAVLYSKEREARAKAEESVARLRDLEVISEAALTHLDLDRLL